MSVVFAVVAIHEKRIWVRLVEKSFNLFHYSTPGIDTKHINKPEKLPPSAGNAHYYTCFSCGEDALVSAPICPSCQRERPPSPFGFRCAVLRR